MVKARDILFTVGKVFTIISIVSFFLAGFILTVLGVLGMTGMLISFSEIDEYAPSDDVAAGVITAGIIWIMLGLFFSSFGILAIINLIIISNARIKQTKGLYIAGIVFGYLISTPSMVASIFGLIILKREENRLNSSSTIEE